MTDDQEFFQSSEFQELLKNYEESVKSGYPIYMDADDLADIADYYQLQGKTEEAKAAINLALQFNPEAVGPLLFKAREALLAEDFEAAEAYAERLEAGDSREALYLKGEILIRKNEIEAADELYRQYYKDVEPDEQMDYVYDIANIFSEYLVFDKSFEWMARSQGDDSDDFKELMGRTLFGLGKFKDSEKIFNELIDKDPYSSNYWNALASTQYMTEDYHSAITSSEYAIAIDPHDADALLSKANSLFGLNNYEEALSYFKKYSEILDDDEFGLLRQGSCHINLGHFSEAVEILQKAEEVSPSDSIYLPDIYQELAFANNELHRPETALYYLDKTEDLDCDHINIAVIRGHILLYNKRSEEAEAVFKKALIDSGNSPKVMLRIIISLYDNQYVQTAYRLLRQFFEEIDDPEWKEGYAYMALICKDMNYKDEFLHYLKMACEKNPKEAMNVLECLFPKEMEVKDYYEYMLNLIKNE